MKIFFLVSFYLFLFVPGLFCQRTAQPVVYNFRDSNTFTVLSFKEIKSNFYFFDSSCINAALSTAEIALVERLFGKGITDYNKKIKNQANASPKSAKEKKELMDDFSIPYTDSTYIKQLIPVIDKKNQKRVYINCVAVDLHYKDDYWRKKFILIMDGGNSSFQVILNITTETIEYVGINGFG